MYGVDGWYGVEKVWSCDIRVYSVIMGLLGDNRTCTHVHIPYTMMTNLFQMTFLFIPNINLVHLSINLIFSWLFLFLYSEGLYSNHLPEHRIVENKLWGQNRHWIWALFLHMIKLMKIDDDTCINPFYQFSSVNSLFQIKSPFKEAILFKLDEWLGTEQNCNWEERPLADRYNEWAIFGIFNLIESSNRIIICRFYDELKTHDSLLNKCAPLYLIE